MALYYASIADLDSLLTTEEKVEITTESGDTPDTTILTAALEEAEAMVNSKIGVRYDVPLRASDDSVPPELRRATITVARFYLYDRRVPRAGVVDSYEDAVRWLDDVSRGRAVINLVVDGDAENNSSDRSGYGTADRTNVSFNDLLT